MKILTHGLRHVILKVISQIASSFVHFQLASLDYTHFQPKGVGYGGNAPQPLLLHLLFNRG